MNINVIFIHIFKLYIMSFQNNLVGFPTYKCINLLDFPALQADFINYLDNTNLSKTHFPFYFKGTVNGILNDCLVIEWLVRFTRVPLQ